MLGQTNSAAQERMVELLYSLAPGEGYTQSLLEGVRFMRSNRPLRLTPVLYEPSIVIVCQGRKKRVSGQRRLRLRRNALPRPVRATALYLRDGSQC